MRDIYDVHQTIPSLSDSRAGRKVVSYIDTLPDGCIMRRRNRESIIIKKQGRGYPKGISRTVFPHTKTVSRIQRSAVAGFAGCIAESGCGIQKLFCQANRFFSYPQVDGKRNFGKGGYIYISKIRHVKDAYASNRSILIR